MSGLTRSALSKMIMTIGFDSLSVCAIYMKTPMSPSAQLLPLIALQECGTLPVILFVKPKGLVLQAANILILPLRDMGNTHLL